jgi:hypothetical protein
MLDVRGRIPCLCVFGRSGAEIDARTALKCAEALLGRPLHRIIVSGITGRIRTTGLRVWPHEAVIVRRQTISAGRRVLRLVRQRGGPPLAVGLAPDVIKCGESSREHRLGQLLVPLAVSTIVIRRC